MHRWVGFINLHSGVSLLPITTYLYQQILTSRPAWHAKSQRTHLEIMGIQSWISLPHTSLWESKRYQPACIKHIIHENNILGISFIADYANGHTIETSVIF